MDKVQVIQNKAIRIIHRMNRNCTVSQLYSASKIISIEDRMVQLGCRYLQKSLPLNENIQILVKEYVASISSIKRDNKRNTPLCVFLTLYVLALAYQTFILLTHLGLRSSSLMPNEFGLDLKKRRYIQKRKILLVL